MSVYLMEPTTGIEPVNLILTKDVLYLLSYVGTKIKCLKSSKVPKFYKFNALCNDVTLTKIAYSFYNGAGNGARTRDPQLGRLTL